MKTISLSILLGLLLLSSGYTSAFADDLTINGSAYFECNLQSKYMEKHGYSFIKEVSYQNYLKTNIYAASDAQVLIKDKNNITVGNDRTDGKGRFSVTVPREDGYQIIVQFHGNEFNKTVSFPEAKKYYIGLGHFSSENVGSWIDARLDLQQ